MTTETNGLAESTGVTNPLILLQSMIDRGADPSALRQMMDLAERFEANQAKKAYAEAMNQCQAKMPTVIRDKMNNQTQKMYAPVETVKTYAKPVYTEAGFALEFTAEAGTGPGLTTVHLDVTHVQGHTKRTTLPNVPLDDKGPKGGDVKTQIQGLMSSMSYAQGRLICLAFNLTVADEDRDGQHLLTRVGPDEIKAINALFEQCRNAGKPVNVQLFLKWLTPRGQAEPMESLEFLLMRDFTKACNELLRKLAEPTKKKETT